MSARLPLGILLTAAPVLMVPAVSVFQALLEDAPEALSAAALPLALLVPLLLSVGGVLMVRTERRPMLHRSLAFTAACLGGLGAALGALMMAVTALPGGMADRTPRG